MLRNQPILTTNRRSMATGLLVAVALLVAGNNALAQKKTFTDQDVTDHIQDELLADHAVRAHKIDISTSDGIVTLTGSVDNIMAKERAARIAETVKGVRSVINRVKVVPSPQVTDKQIQNAVIANLAADPATESWEIGVKVKNGSVTLTGEVDSWQEKELAAKVAKGARGVTDLKNQIKVDYARNRTDTEIRHDVTRTMLWDNRIDSGLVDVEVNDGIVNLSGIVGSAAEKRLARTAAWVAGVKAVETDDLEVERWARDKQLRKDKFVARSAQEIKDAVNDALLIDPRVHSFEITVEPLGSNVTLRGTVDNLKAKQAAEQVAERTVGVTTVTNRIKVRPSEPLVSDEEIETSIRRAFSNDPYVDRYDLTVSVINGVAHIYGTVDSYYEQTQAKDLASRVYGVVDVQDRITVAYDNPYVYDPYIDDGLNDHLEDYDYESTPSLTTASDEEIDEAINDEFYWSPYVDASNVQVSVDDGVATLSGTVDSDVEKDKAAENAWEGGATWVINNLEVK